MSLKPSRVLVCGEVQSFVSKSCLSVSYCGSHLGLSAFHFPLFVFHSSYSLHTCTCASQVLDYTCLTWATMYTDRCYNTTNAPRTPCRSFCVDVAMTCANDPFDWVNLCHNIACPMAEGKCARNSNGTDLTSPGPHGRGSGEGPGQGQAWSNGNIITRKEGSYVEDDGDERTKDCWVVKVPSAYSAAFSTTHYGSASSISFLLASVASALACAVALAY